MERSFNASLGLLDVFILQAKSKSCRTSVVDRISSRYIPTLLGQFKMFSRSKCCFFGARLCFQHVSARCFRNRKMRSFPVQLTFAFWPQLLDIVREPQSKTPSLVFEYVNNTDFKVNSLPATLFWLANLRKNKCHNYYHRKLLHSAAVWVILFF